LIEVLPHHKGLLTETKDWGNSSFVEEMKDFTQSKWKILGMWFKSIPPQTLKDGR